MTPCNFTEVDVEVKHASKKNQKNYIIFNWLREKIQAVVRVRHHKIRHRIIPKQIQIMYYLAAYHQKILPPKAMKKL